jgi:hypothetical protein
MSNFSDFNSCSNDFFKFNSKAYDRDKNLLSLQVNEIINLHGVCMDYYITTYDTRYDRIWGEDNDRRFERNFDFMAMYQLPREDKIWSKFGIEGTDTITMSISKRHFSAASKHPQNGSQHIPQIGDIIMAKYNNYVYEITEVAEDVGMYLNSKQHVWEFVVIPFKDEGIATTAETSASSISAFTDKPTDIFDIKNDIDVAKEEVIYKPKPSEKPSDDPFSNW